MDLILFLQESSSLFIAEVGEITRLSFHFVWREADKEFQNDGSNYSTIPCSIPRPVEISPKKFGCLSPSHTVTLATVFGSEIPVSGLVA